MNTMIWNLLESFVCDNVAHVYRFGVENILKQIFREYYNTFQKCVDTFVLHLLILC